MQATSQADDGARRFVLVRTLGEGTFGSVYLADMEGAGGFRRRVALKLLNSNWDPSSDAGRRLRDEARLLGRLHHRNIVRVDDLIRLSGKWALVMEYIGGADLEVLLQDARARGEGLPPRAVAEAGIAVASALDAAWNAPGDDDNPLHVVHRDIKPSNVRLADDGEIKVLDFGVARAEFTGREAKTERHRYGSLGYMAPERLLGESETTAGDIYGLGVMIWELVTGETYGRSELGMDQQAAQVERARASLERRLPGSGLVGLVVSCLAYAPSLRPSATEVEAALRALARELSGDGLVEVARTSIVAIRGQPPGDSIEGRVLVADTTSSPDSVAAIVNSATISLPSDDLAMSAALEPARRPPFASIAVGVAVVLAIGGGLWMSRPEPPPAAPIPVAVPAPIVAPEPVAAPTPEPVAPVVAREPVVVAPPPAVVGAATPRSTTKTRATEPVVEVAPAAPTPPAPDAPRLRSAKFNLSGAEGMKVDCSGVRNEGSTSVLVREFPAGTCVVAVGALRTSVELAQPRAVHCSVDAGVLTCR